MKLLAVIDLLYYDNKINLLYDKLLSLKKDHYDPDERIVILQTDTDYYYFNNLVGFTINNLFNCWKSIDLPFFIMHLCSHQSKIKDAIATYDISKYDYPTVTTELFHYANYIIPISDRNVNIENVKYPAICLNGGIVRPHRTKIMQYLTKFNLLNNVKTSYNAAGFDGYKDLDTISSDTSISADIINPRFDTMDIIFSQPHRFRSTTFKITTNEDILNLHNIPVESYIDPLLASNIDGVYQNFFVDIVSETVFDSPHVYITEKTLRPIWFKRPFIIFGAAGSLKHLKSFGIKTFNEFWDEGYDDILNPDERFLEVARLINVIASKPIDELKNMLYNMHCILEHNYKILVENKSKCAEIFEPIRIAKEKI